jgi:hypothetical protein
MKSQLAGKSKNDAGTSKEYFGISFNHLASRDKIEIGNKVFNLLNYSMNDFEFASSIPGNGSSSSLNSVMLQNSNEEIDSTIYRYDTGFIKIISPEKGISLMMDSLMVVSLKIDTSENFKDIDVLFQNNAYFSSSKASLQTLVFRLTQDILAHPCYLLSRM